jgi:hypothetical protein
MNIIIEQEKLLLQAWFSNDKLVVEDLLHPEFSEVAESGKRHHYSDVLSSMGNVTHSENKIHSQDYELINLQSGAMLLLYKLAILKPTGEYSSFTKRSSVWIKLEGQWKMKYHQGTYCDEFDIKI